MFERTTQIFVDRARGSVVTIYREFEWMDDFRKDDIILEANFADAEAMADGLPDIIFDGFIDDGEGFSEDRAFIQTMLGICHLTKAFLTPEFAKRIDGYLNLLDPYPGMKIQIRVNRYPGLGERR